MDPFVVWTLVSTFGIIAFLMMYMVLEHKFSIDYGLLVYAEELDRWNKQYAEWMEREEEEYTFRTQVLALLDSISKEAHWVAKKMSM